MSGLPGTTRDRTSSKFLRDCSSFHVVAPGDIGCSGIGVRPMWHATQRALPSRLVTKIGWTLFLKNS